MSLILLDWDAEVSSGIDLHDFAEDGATATLAP